MLTIQQIPSLSKDAIRLYEKEYEENRQSHVLAILEHTTLHLQLANIVIQYLLPTPRFLKNFDALEHIRDFKEVLARENTRQQLLQRDITFTKRKNFMLMCVQSCLNRHA